MKNETKEYKKGEVVAYKVKTSSGINIDKVIFTVFDETETLLKDQCGNSILKSRAIRLTAEEESNIRRQWITYYMCDKN